MLCCSIAPWLEEIRGYPDENDLHPPGLGNLLMREEPPKSLYQELVLLTINGVNDG